MMVSDNDDEDVLTENVRIELLRKPRSGPDPTSRRDPIAVHTQEIVLLQCYSSRSRCRKLCFRTWRTLLMLMLMLNCIAAPKVHGSSRVHSDSVTGQRNRSLVHRIVH